MDVYETLHKKLDSLAIPFPKTENKVELELLRKLFTPQEAEIACNMSMIPETAKTIAERMGAESEKLQSALEAMGRKGLINANAAIGPEPLYCLAPVYPGVWDFQVNRLNKETAELFERHFTATRREILGDLKSPLMRVIPINRSISAESSILPYEEAEKYIDQSAEIALANCICRTHKATLGKPCEHPRDYICILLSPVAEQYIEYGLGRKATKEEAKTALRRAEEAGLVHSVINVQSGGAICNCCSCSCMYLSSVKSQAVPNALAKSNFVVQFSKEKCTACGDCVERCQMGAISLNDSIISITMERCIGCGLCVGTCSTGALALQRRDKEYVPPNDFKNLFLDNLEHRYGKE